jgi:hypothetical protein
VRKHKTPRLAVAVLARSSFDRDSIAKLLQNVVYGLRVGFPGLFNVSSIRIE